MCRITKSNVRGSEAHATGPGPHLWYSMYVDGTPNSSVLALRLAALKLLTLKHRILIICKAHSLKNPEFQFLLVHNIRCSENFKKPGGV